MCNCPLDGPQNVLEGHGLPLEWTPRPEWWSSCDNNHNSNEFPAALLWSSIFAQLNGRTFVVTCCCCEWLTWWRQRRDELEQFMSPNDRPTTACQRSCNNSSRSAVSLSLGRSVGRRCKKQMKPAWIEGRWHWESKSLYNGFLGPTINRTSSFPNTELWTGWNGPFIGKLLLKRGPLSEWYSCSWILLWMVKIRIEIGDVTDLP